MKRDFINITIMNCAILFFLLTAYSCSETPTEPEQIKDPREYVWSVDTIKYPEEDGVVQSLISSVWGSSENDVYITGHADTGNRIFHFSGKTWEVIEREVDGIRRSFLGEWIYGFGGSDVWVAGQVQAAFGSPLFPKEVPALIHYNGSQWEMHELPVEGRFWYVWGKSSNNLWACGLGGLIGHYDGNDWEIDTIQVAAGNGGLGIRSIIEYNNTAYAIGFNNPILYFCKKESGNKWEVIDSVETIYLDNYPFGTNQFYLTSDNRLLSYGTGGVWEYKGSGWDKIITTERTTSGLIEYTKGKFIIVDFLGKVYHYSEGTLEEIGDFGDSGRIYEVWANSKECFIVVNKPGGGIYSSTVIYHGK